ncbi:hypothetical protein [Eikenella corrodens]|jgi:hypothetical protein|uniref:Peptidase C-terminal archaeal/bacterial domain-containing protein n=3 Tax=Eikenella corrodens TaxID=539 RepID=V7IE74_EIKCO|nr:hypothetical protein [Eikenella corrodens]EEG24085.1 hypothetical protein EIKCOROL_01254 [Eikenella corrodens ATCC 23834]ETA83581.1 hypothetical protein HMPREF1177_00768 [Eikenella corrodens CC92I]MDU4299564.1 hypothetical protein [Eikenella corrodens]OAM17115.1 hypothetical protein A7P84_07500 [Eikenella corrodens]OAM17849.1 hypothetical protein A7P90_09115 [Eikenella corrodens]
MKQFAVLGLAALIAAPAALAEPRSSWLPEVQQVYKQLMQEKDPGARQAELFQGSAKVGETKTHQIQLTAGKYYTFFAACDHDCNNIDLTLKSADGSVVKADTEEDDAPMFGLRPTRTGRYTLSVTIPGCKTASGCQYSSNVFVGNQQIFRD